MTTMQETKTCAAPLSIWGADRARGLFAAWAARRKARFEARWIRGTAAELNALDDHILRDIGLVRGAIETQLRDQIAAQGRRD